MSQKVRELFCSECFCEEKNCWTCAPNRIPVSATAVLVRFHWDLAKIASQRAKWLAKRAPKARASPIHFASGFDALNPAARSVVRIGLGVLCLDACGQCRSWLSYSRFSVFSPLRQNGEKEPV